MSLAGGRRPAGPPSAVPLLLAALAASIACAGPPTPAEVERPPAPSTPELPRTGDGTGPRRTRVEEVVEVPVPGVPVRIAGETLRLGFDTGQSPALMLSPACIERLGLEIVGQRVVGDGSGENSRRVDIAAVDVVRLGGARFEDVLAFVMDMPDGDGAVGFSLFAGCLLTLDLGQGRLVVELGALPETDGEEVLPLLLDRGVTPCVEIEVAGSRERALLDSGWNGGWLVLPEPFVDTLPLVEPPQHAGRVATLFNEFDRWTATLDGDLRVGGHRFEDPEVEFNGLMREPILGQRFLSEVVVTFDIERQRVRLRR